MPDLRDGESVEMKGSGAKPYTLKNVGGVYSCSCPAWRNQSVPIERRTCKHLRKLRGDAAEEARTGGTVSLPARPAPSNDDSKVPALLLAESWDTVTDPTGWWVSEKLDRVRALWDGSGLWSRQGNRFHAPDWFVAGLPTEPLDGELWIGRKQFQRTVSIVRRQDQSEHWKEVRYVVFDAPKLDKDFETRLAFVQECLASDRPAYALAHVHQRCEGLDHLRAELERLEILGAEGLMLRQAGSRYESGRSAMLLKVKRFHDAEARVLKHLPGAGRHEGRLGALLVEMPDGTTFSVGTGFSDAERENPAPVGTFITYRYQELSEGGVPRFPSYVGIRAESVPAPATSKGELLMTTSIVAVRRFEFTEGNSKKFWEIAVQGSEVTARYGRIGSQGQTTVKSFADSTAAAKYVTKLIAEKTDKGYREIS
jgi:DNA ligase-1